MAKIRIILVDDHHIVRDGIKALISGAAEIEIIGEASSGHELFEIMKNRATDVVVMDISMPDMSGIELTRIITQDYRPTKVLILSMYKSEDYISNSIKAGAKGYLPKNTTRRELIEAIKAVHSGEEYFSDEVSKIIMKSYYRQTKHTDESEKKEVNLTKRELEILKLFAEGYINKEIAEKLYISIRTVESHKNHIMQKLEMKTTVDLVKYAIKKGIISI